MIYLGQKLSFTSNKEGNYESFENKMTESTKMFKRTIGIDPNQQFKVIIQKMLPV